MSGAKMNRARLFLENFLVYGLMNALNKVIPILLLPVLTRYLGSTAEFGRFDMYYTIVQFGSNLAVLGMYDAMFREYFEREDSLYKAKVTAVALKIVCAAGGVMAFAMLLFSAEFSQLFFGDGRSEGILCLAAIGIFLSAVQVILSAPTRMRNERRIFIFTGLGSSSCYYGAAIFFVSGGLGHRGMIYANLLSCLALFLVFLFLNRRYFAFAAWNSSIARELFRIGLPLLPTFLIYWVFNSFDKLMIANLLDMAQLGIYSIGLRVASVSHFIYAAFAGGWQYFAFSTMRDRDQVQMTSKVFEYLGVLSIAAFLLLLPFGQVIFQCFFAADYVEGYKVFPYLFLAPLFLMLFQVAGNQLLVVKKTKVNTFCLLAGVACNIGLNFIFIGSYGIRGCALATLLGYMVSVFCIAAVTCHMGLLRISKRFLLLISMLLFLLGFHFLEKPGESYLYFGIILLLPALYQSEIWSIGKRINHLCFKGKGGDM